MKRTLNLINKTLIAGATATILGTSLAARAAIISVNFIQNPGNDTQQIDSDETYGIASLGTQVGGWLNVNAGANNLPDSAGNPTTVNLSAVSQPNGQATFNIAYADTPLYAGFDDYTATPSACSFTLNNLTTNFPNGYKVIVYVGGFNGNTGASISDGTTTYYYRPDPAPVTPYGTFVPTTQTVNQGAGNNPIAQYAVFGGVTLLTNDTVTFTIDTLSGGGSGLCGFQIIGATATDLAARVWKGNNNSNWDTATLNWTNAFYGATNYAEGDPVFFTDEASAAAPSVNLVGARSPASVTVESTKNYTFTGSGIAGATGLTKRGSGALTLANPNTYAGNTTISAGSLRIGASGAIPDGAGAGDVAVAAGATLDLNGNSEGINGLSGSGTVENTGSAATLTMGLDNDGGTFAGTLQGALSLIKQGTNTQVLSGFSSHSGATVAAQGVLALSPLSAFSTFSALVVSNGASLEASFTNGGGLFTTAPISLNGGVALTVDYGNAAVTGGGAPMTTFGALNLNGVTQIGVRGNNFSVGSYVLISYASKTGGGSVSATPAFLPAGMVATIQDTGSAIVLNVTFPSIQTLAYTFGDGGIWATNAGTVYWNLGNAEYTEYSSGLGDAVQFGTTYNSFPLSGGTVSLTTDVRPYSISASGNYTLTGPGRITGATGLQMAGAAGATFVLDTTNTYTGVTTVSSGTLQLNRASALGSAAGGTLVASGGSLSLSNGITLAGEPLTLNGNGTSGGNNNGALRTLDTNSPITVASPITLGSTARIRAADGGELIITSPITDNGSNYTLFLHAAQTNSIVRLNSASNSAGNLTIYGVSTVRGLISFGVNHVFPGASLTVGGGLFDLNGKDQVFAGLLAGFDPALGVLTNSSPTPATLTIHYNGTNSAQLQSALAGPINVVKLGTGVQSFGGGSAIKHSYSGTTTINGGVLGIASDFSGVSGSFIVNSGGTLRGSGQALGGPVTVNSGGTFYAGFAENAIGNLTISNSLTLAGNLIVALNKDVSPSNDVVTVTGPLAYGGTLTITNLGTNALVAGDTFRVFSPGGTGSIAIVNPPGATFSFADGLLTVTSVSSGQPTLNFTSVGGGVLQFNWTGAYVLQWQTNSLATGLSNNWSDYPDASNPVNVTNHPAIPAAFFRLRSP